MTALVYMATNRVNGKRYIGVTSGRLCSRRAGHIHQALKKEGKCRKFHAAIRKYGPEAFEWAVLIRAGSFAEALTEEIRLIAELRPEYNLTAGGEGTNGIVRSKETVERHRASRAGWRPTPEMRQRQSKAMRGHAVSEETRRKISAAHKGMKYTPETIAAMSAGQRKRFSQSGHTPETRAKMSATRRGRKRPQWVMDKIVAAKRARRPQMELPL
jgi:group I intron endonuclease